VAPLEIYAGKKARESIMKNGTDLRLSYLAIFWGHLAARNGFLWLV